MSIVSISFSKIQAEKHKPIQGKVNVANNVAIKKIEKADFVVGDVKQDCLKFSFEFTSKTEPEIGEIVFGGDVIFLAKKETVADVVAAWNAKKPVQKEIITPVINAVLKKCNIEALVLSQTMNLPAPLKLPSVSPKEASEKAASQE
ncbi:MAG: hypothetical protein ACOC32_01950 [Nanoarchaeota archaeon]